MKKRRKRLIRTKTTQNLPEAFCLIASSRRLTSTFTGCNSTAACRGISLLLSTSRKPPEEPLTLAQDPAVLVARCLMFFFPGARHTYLTDVARCHCERRSDTRRQRESHGQSHRAFCVCRQSPLLSSDRRGERQRRLQVASTWRAHAGA